MMRPHTTLLMGTVYRGEYEVDPLAVAQAILDRRRKRSSKLFEASQPRDERPVGPDERDAAPGSDLA